MYIFILKLGQREYVYEKVLLHITSSPDFLKILSMEYLKFQEEYNFIESWRTKSKKKYALHKNMHVT